MLATPRNSVYLPINQKGTDPHTIFEQNIQGSLWTTHRRYFSNFTVLSCNTSQQLYSVWIHNLESIIIKLVFFQERPMLYSEERVQSIPKPHLWDCYTSERSKQNMTIQLASKQGVVTGYILEYFLHRRTTYISNHWSFRERTDQVRGIWQLLV